MDKQKSTNMVFLPPLGIRYFDIHTLLPYAVEADQMLTYQIYMLWLMLLELQKTQPQRVDFDATERELSIDEDRYGMEADEDSAGSKGNITEQDLKKRSGKNGFTQTAQNKYAKDEKDSKKQGRKQDFLLLQITSYSFQQYRRLTACCLPIQDKSR